LASSSRVMRAACSPFSRCRASSVSVRSASSRRRSSLRRLSSSEVRLRACSRSSRSRSSCS